MCRGGGGKWAARKRARATEFKKRKEVEAPGKDGQETRADGTRETGKESQEKRSNRFRKDDEIKDPQKTVGEQAEVIKNLQEVLAK